MLSKSNVASGEFNESTTASSDAEALNNMLKNNALLNPALLSINPSLYAVQLAQLQAAQLLSHGGLQQLAAARRASEDDDISTGNMRKRKHDSATSSDDPLSSALNLTKRSPSVSPKSGEVSQGRSTAESPLDLSGSKRLGDLGLQMGGVGLGGGGKLPKLDAQSIAGLPWADAMRAGTMPFLHPLLAGSNLSPDALSRFGLAGLAGLTSSASDSLLSTLSTAYSSSMLSTSTTSIPSYSSSGGLPGAPGLGSPGNLGGLGGGPKLSGELRNPLDRMSEIAKGGSQSASLNSSSASTTSTSSMRPSLGPRHSAWQSQWISRGPESNKDIFKCVWCKDSFSSLQALTIHMKETKHFGGNIPPSPQMPVRSPLVSPTTHTTPSRTGPIAYSPSSTPPSQALSSAPSNHSTPNKPPRDILKEQLPMPRKLVRGQDVWLGRGEQQTKDILKCMWCGQSFRTLEIMTQHMQETKHYTKVISQEQLVSWKSPDSAVTSQNHVNAVLTCKVCDQAFSSLKELSDHMMKNNHYKEAGRPGGPPGAALGPDKPNHGNSANLGRSSGGTTPTGLRGAPSPASVAAAASLNNQSKEKRKKSLPVRKLLELERAQQELTGQPMTDEATGRISCEKCGDKIPMHVFVDHIRQCVGPLLPLQAAALAAARSGLSPATSASDFLNAAASGRLLPASTMSMTPNRRTPSVSPPRKSPMTPSTSIFGALNSENLPKKKSTQQNVGSSSTEPDSDEPKSILGSLEQMVQKNFGAKKRQPGPDSNMSILQRLGIDEGVDYSKPLVDPMAAMSAMFRPPPGSSMASLAGFLPPFSHSTSTRSNSSECSSPDRFKNDRPASIKSDSSVKSPPLEENAIPASGILSALQRNANIPPALLSLHGKSRTSPALKEGKDEEREEEKIDDDSDKASDDLGRRIIPLNGEDKNDTLDEKTLKNKGSSNIGAEKKDAAEYTERYAKRDEGNKVHDVEMSPRNRSPNLASSPVRSDCASPPHSIHPVAPILGDITTSPPGLSSNNNKSRSSSPLNSNDGGQSSTFYSDLNEINDLKPKTVSDKSNNDEDHNAQSPSIIDDTDNDKEKTNNKNKKKPKSHPLAALQMLCDKNERPSNTNKNGSSSSSGNYGGPGTDPGAILAFSWACNQAVVNDSLLKCPFCDTPFISKGAYRHHLSKMHFVKDGSTPDPKMFMKAAQQAAATGHPDDKQAAVVMAAAAVNAAQHAVAASAAVAAAADTKEENTQSKFQKYSQLAKQLSCSSQP